MTGRCGTGLEPVEFAAASGLRSVTACDLCGLRAFAVVAQASPDCCRTVMCLHCGLFFAAPSLPVEALETFYDEEFDGDPGAGTRLLGGEIEARRVRKEERAARGWALPIIRRHLDPAGKRILDVRSRTGGLAQALKDAGAEVVVVDPMKPNVEHVRRRRGIEARFVPVKDLGTLPGFREGEFDAVTALTIHTLGHLPSPAAFLDRLHALLKPGGLLFLDEKDVLQSARGIGRSVFHSGRAHFFHFTEATVRAYLESAGFEIAECAGDPQRRSAFRHLRIVARNGERPVVRAAAPAIDASRLLDDLARAERRQRLGRVVNLAMKTTGRAARQAIGRLTGRKAGAR